MMASRQKSVQLSGGEALVPLVAWWCLACLLCTTVICCCVAQITWPKTRVMMKMMINNIRMQFMMV